MTLGWTRYCSDFGPMGAAPHAEETSGRAGRKDAYMAWDRQRISLGERFPWKRIRRSIFLPLVVACV
jgi:hypothetical protein